MNVPQGHRLDGLPDEARCGLCGELIVASRSVNGRVMWCHAEVPSGGHEALHVATTEWRSTFLGGDGGGA